MIRKYPDLGVVTRFHNPNDSTHFDLSSAQINQVLEACGYVDTVLLHDKAREVLLDALEGQHAPTHPNSIVSLDVAKFVLSRVPETNK